MLLLLALLIASAEDLRAESSPAAFRALAEKKDSTLLDTAWSHLASSDLEVRAAAQLALEKLPLETWQRRALLETDPPTALGALLALARTAPRPLLPELIEALTVLPIEGLAEEQQREALAINVLSFQRLGPPPEDEVRQAIGLWAALFPVKGARFNQELAAFLCALGSPEATAKTWELLARASTPAERRSYAPILAQTSAGWTPELRRKFLDWLANAAVDSATAADDRAAFTQLREKAAARFAKEPDEFRPTPPR